MHTTRTLFMFSIAKRPIKNKSRPIISIPPTKITLIPTQLPKKGKQRPAKT